VKLPTLKADQIDWEGVSLNQMSRSELVAAVVVLINERSRLEGQHEDGAWCRKYLTGPHGRADGLGS